MEGGAVVHIRTYWFLSAALALLTGVLVFRYLNLARAEEFVLVAAEDVPAFSRVGEEKFRRVAISSSAIHPRALRDATEATGKYTLQPLTAGEQVLATKLSGEERFADPLGALEAEQRAMFLPVGTGRGPGGTLRPGQRVDLIFVSDEGKTGYRVSKTLLEGVPVMASIGEESVLRPGSREYLAGIIVAVRPEEAERVAFALENGVIYITLQGPDARSLKTAGVCAENVFGPLPRGTVGE